MVTHRQNDDRVIFNITLTFILNLKLHADDSTISKASQITFFNRWTQPIFLKQPLPLAVKLKATYLANVFC